MAEDPDSGRREFFPSRGSQLDVTSVVADKGLRVENGNVASIQRMGRRTVVVKGRYPGKTQVKVRAMKVCILAWFYYCELCITL